MAVKIQLFGVQFCRMFCNSELQCCFPICVPFCIRYIIINIEFGLLVTVCMLFLKTAITVGEHTPSPMSLPAEQI